MHMDDDKDGIWKNSYLGYYHVVWNGKQNIQAENVYYQETT